MDFDDISIVGLVLGVIGGLFSVFITDRMGGGLFLKLAGMLITGVVCYFVGGKIAESG